MPLGSQCAGFCWRRRRPKSSPFAEAHDGVEDDGAECCRTDASKRKAENGQREVSAAQNHCDGSNDQITVLAEIDLIYNPDAGACHSDETKDDDRGAA